MNHFKRHFKSVDSLFRYLHTNHRDHVVYRGQSSSSWELESRLSREIGIIGADPFEYKKKYEIMLSSFKSELDRLDMLSDYQDDFLNIESLGQHHGLPTRLLDWTYYIYIAIFFAYEGITRNKIINPNIAIWVLDLAKFKAGTISKEALGSPKQENINDHYANFKTRDYSIYHLHDLSNFSNSRIRKQNGTFILCNYSSQPLNKYIDEGFPSDTLIKITAPSGLQRDVLNRLNHMGINAGSLMDNMDGVAIDIAWKYFRN